MQYSESKIIKSEYYILWLKYPVLGTAEHCPIYNFCTKNLIQYAQNAKLEGTVTDTRAEINLYAEVKFVHGQEQYSGFFQHKGIHYSSSRVKTQKAGYRV